MTVLTLAGLISAYARVAVLSSLAGWWPMANGSGATATDRSGKGGDGALTGAPAWVGGKFGTGIEFDGSTQYMTVTPPAAITAYQGNRTVAFWFQVPSFPGVNYRELVITGNSINPATPMWEVNVAPSNGLDIYHGGGHVAVCTSCINPSTWYHTAYTFSGNALYTAYLNGVKRLQGSAPDQNFQRNNIYVATGFWGKTPMKIDELRIYTRALSAGEVGQLYRSGADRYSQ